MPDTDPLTNAVLGYSASQRCNVANPGGQPCSRRKGHTGAHDAESYGPAEPTVEECLKELREFPDVAIHVTARLNGTRWRIWLGLRGGNFYGSSFSECVAQVRAYLKEQEK